MEFQNIINFVDIVDAETALVSTTTADFVKHFKGRQNITVKDIGNDGNVLFHIPHLEYVEFKCRQNPGPNLGAIAIDALIASSAAPSNKRTREKTVKDASSFSSKSSSKREKIVKPAIAAVSAVAAAPSKKRTTEKAGKWSIGDRVEVFESKDRPKEILAGSYYAGQITGIKDGIATVILEHNRGKVKTLIENLRQVRKGDPTIDYQIGDRIDVFCPKTGNSWWEATIKEIGHNRKTFIVHFTNEKCEDEEVGISKLRPTMPA